MLKKEGSFMKNKPLLRTPQCPPLFSLSVAMILKASPFLSLQSPPTSLNITTSFSPFTPLLHFPTKSPGIGPTVAVAAASEASGGPITGVIFQPFEELKQHQELNLVPAVPDQSLARHKFSSDCEAALNEQINVEYNISYIYHAMYAYFDRDNIALQGLAHFFKESSEEEREHAEIFMEYQNQRGGRVKLQSILMPLSEFDHSEKGDALHAMELALSLEKLTTEKLVNLRNVAEWCNDIQMVDFVESNFLGEQVEAIKKISEHVAQLRRVGKGHGVWHFDQMLLHGGNGAA